MNEILLLLTNWKINRQSANQFTEFFVVGVVVVVLHAYEFVSISSITMIYNICEQIKMNAGHLLRYIDGVLRTLCHFIVFFCCCLSLSVFD